MEKGWDGFEGETFVLKNQASNALKAVKYQRHHVTTQKQVGCSNP